MGAWVLGVPVVLLLAVYFALLISPIPLPFVRDPVRTAVLAALPPTAELELGDMALTLEGGAWPVIQFSPVSFTDKKSGATISMDALDVGFSPIRAIIGQPGAVVTIVGPHIQVNQDLFGPRLSRFEIVEDPGGGRPTVRVIEGQDAFPAVGISSEGVDVRGELPEGAIGGMRSDNDWLIYNLEAAEKGIADIVDQANQGLFSRLVIRNGTLDMNDALYGLFRTFDNIELDIAPKADGKTVEGKFSAEFGGHTMHGIVERIAGSEGKTRLKTAVTNIDFSSFLPFVNDTESLVAVVGAGALSADVSFDAETGKVIEGLFQVDMTGTDLRVEDDYFPIATSIVDVRWTPENGQFEMAEAQLNIGQSSGRVGGVFRLGLDELYGPTVGMSVTARDVALHPNDMGPPQSPFAEIRFSGWSAPLYGAMGIDQFEVEKGDGARIATIGRADILRQGLGFELTIAGEGVSADDLKRVWPYFIARETRDWVVRNVTAGVVQSSTMKYAFPVGTLARKGEDKPIPPNGMQIDMVGVGVAIRPIDTMSPITIEGETGLQVRDNVVTIAADGAQLDTASGSISVADAALVIDSSTPESRVIEVSGDVSGGIPAILALAREQQPEAVGNLDLPIDIDALTGSIEVGLVATILTGAEGAAPVIDYALSGTVADFGSSAPIQARTISEGQLAFTASQAGYNIQGKAAIDGMPADVVVTGTPDGVPVMQLASTMDVKDLGAMGFDASEFLSGQVRFVAQPMPDQSIQMAVDLENAALDIKDLGIRKAKGVKGRLQAAIKQNGDVTEISQIVLAFADVNLQGSIDYDKDKGLQSAEFSSFALSPGDNAQLSLTPVRDGYAVRLRGDQLDLKPMLQRFFNLGEGAGGVQSTQFNQTIALDVELKRALGFYKTTAFNLDVDLTLKGPDLQRVSMQAQLGGDKSIAVTTNSTPTGRIMSVAFNDLGTVLRLIGVYPRVEGGEGTLVLNNITREKVEYGEFQLRNFALIDEDKVVQILGNHQESRQLIARENKLAFRSGKANFLRRRDRVEVSEGILTGDTVGGTLRGFIYTDKRQYDLTGTYVPLFGLNSVFQKLPILGPLLGGRDGEGLVGVTFAVRGALENPDFHINPVSALVPGALRALFEYRAKEQPRVE